MRHLCAVAMALTIAAPGLVQAETYADLPQDVRDVMADFIPDGLHVTADLDQIKVRRGQNVINGRVQYELQFPATADDGTKWLLHFEIDAERHYVAWYSAAAGDAHTRATLVSRDFALSREEVEAIARSFAAEHFPRPLDALELSHVSAPLSRFAGGYAYYIFSWRGRAGEAETGDSLVMSISPNTGGVLNYLARPALDFGEDDVVVSRDEAVDIVRAEIEAAGRVDLAEVTFWATLVLSHPQTNGEGPAWRIVAIRPPLVGSYGYEMDRRLLRIVDARTRQVFLLPDDMFPDRWFFTPDANGQE